MIYRVGFIALMFLALCSATLHASEPLPALTETPIWANDFVDTIGENTHCTFARIGWVDCKNPTAAAAAIQTLGVRHIRDGISDYWNGYNDNGVPHIPAYKIGSVNTPVTTFYNELAQRAGVKFDFVTDIRYGKHAPYIRDVVAAVPATEAFELGGNEPDNPTYPDPCPSPNPDGLSCWPTDVVNQIRYYAHDVQAVNRVRVGPSILYGKEYTCSHVPGSQKVVLTAAECPTNGAQNITVLKDLIADLDAANLHFYAGEKHPGNGIVAQYRSAARRTSSPDSVTWMTEAGYGTGKNGNSDETITKYEPRLFAEHYYEGVTRTYQFEMFDQTAAAGGSYFDSFGLLAVDWSNLTLKPKPQYQALRSLIHIMNDPGQRPSLEPLSYAIAGGDARLHHILAQRQDGTYQLLMWIEGPDPTPAQTVELSFCAKPLTFAALAQFTPTNGRFVNSILTPATKAGCKVYGPLNVTDAMQIYRFGTKQFWPAQPLPDATPFVGAIGA